MINYDIQKNDFSIIEIKNVSLEQVLSAFDDINWEYELSLVNENDDEKNCPPCIYIHHEDSMLHIVPYDENNFFFIFNYSYKTKTFGIFPSTKNEYHQVDQYKLEDIHSLIELFVSDDKNEILYIG